MRSTMMDLPLTVTAIMRYGTGLFGGREVVPGRMLAVYHPFEYTAGRIAWRTMKQIRRG